ncbi:MAG: universal stress protein [Desulfobulbaceae bacterium]|nr:MAG: universal stress protein [Desulfobulbaceae bacterium]
MKILVGYRGVNVGKDLLKEAVKQAKAFGGEVHVMTSMFGGEKTEKEKIEEAEENLENAQKYLADKGVQCETHLLIRGRTPGEDIVEFAREIGADEVIIAVKSRSKVGKLIFGSTAQYVILKAGCPVISIR